MVLYPIPDRAMSVIIRSSGPVHVVFTFTGTSTAGLNSTMQVRVTSDPSGQIGLTGSLVITMEIGGETVQ